MLVIKEEKIVIEWPNGFQPKIEKERLKTPKENFSSPSSRNRS